MDSDGVPEVGFGLYTYGTDFTFFNGADGAVKSQLTVTKPNPDWEAYIDEDVGYYCSNSGECYTKLQDIDGDGNKEFFVTVSSWTFTSHKSIAKLYDANTKALKWESAEASLSLGAQEYGGVYWTAVNMDSDLQKELVLVKEVYNSVTRQYSSSVFVYDGATKALQWSKTDTAGAYFSGEESLIDINNDGITEVYFAPYYTAPGNSNISFYNGSNGVLAKQITLTKPSSDWVAYLGGVGRVYNESGGGYWTLFDVDGDGSKEFFVTLSSDTPTSAKGIAQLYRVSDGSLEWQSDEASLTWGAQQYGSISWSLHNLDGDLQKEISLWKVLQNNSYPPNLIIDLTIYDGASKSQQWNRSFGGGYSYYDTEEFRDVDSDGIPELQSCAAVECKYYDGETGTLKAELVPVRPNADWEYYAPWTGWSASPDGDNFMKLYDMDGDGNKEFFVQISSVTATGISAKLQIYNASTKALKWESDMQTLALGANEWAIFDSVEGNIDSDPAKEFIVNLSKYNSTTGTRTGSVTVYEYAMPGTAVTPASSATITSEIADIEIPAAAFAANVSITVTTPPSIYPPAAGQSATGVAVSISVTPAIQPGKGISISIPYSLTDIAGLTESRLVIARYDEASGKWIPLPSTVDTLNRKVTAVTSHFSVFQIMQITPSSTVSGVTAGPNPYRPSSNPGQAVTFRNLPADGKVKIYSYLGELLRELSADGSGMAAWNGKNTAGQPVASGVYLALVQGSGGKKMLKIMVER